MRNRVDHITDFVAAVTDGLAEEERASVSHSKTLIVEACGRFGVAAKIRDSQRPPIFPAVNLGDSLGRALLDVIPRDANGEPLPVDSVQLAIAVLGPIQARKALLSAERIGKDRRQGDERVKTVRAVARALDLDGQGGSVPASVGTSGGRTAEELARGSQAGAAQAIRMLADAYEQSLPAFPEPVYDRL